MIIHTVQSGDSLYSIGKRYGVTVSDLIEANGETVQPTLIIGQAIVVPTPTDNAGEIYVNGYTYPEMDKSNLFATLPYLTFISPFSHGIKRDGTVLPLDDNGIIAIADNNNVRPLLVVTTLTERGNFSSANAAAVLDDPVLTQNLINNIIAMLQSANYFGADIDFEYIPPEYMQSYANFITRLREMAEPLGYKIFVALAPKTSSNQRGLLYEAHSYELLGAAADYVLLMTYEWGYTYGPPMAVSPIEKVEEVLRYAITVIPEQKIMLGIPNYAYDWTLPFVRGTAARSMSNNDAITLARERGGTIIFDESSKTPYFTYYDENARQHIVWFEDARSIDAKLELVSSFGLAGISIWNIVSFFKPMYTVLESRFKIIKE